MKHTISRRRFVTTTADFNQKLLWDNELMKVTNLEAANEWVRRPYRKGWSL
jgi:hypothetical protein